MRTSGRTPGVGTAMGELVVAEGTAVVLFWQLELSTELGARCGRRGTRRVVVASLSLSSCRSSPDLGRSTRLAADAGVPATRTPHRQRPQAQEPLPLAPAPQGEPTHSSSSSSLPSTNTRLTSAPPLAPAASPSTYLRSLHLRRPPARRPAALSLDGSHRRLPRSRRAPERAQHPRRLAPAHPRPAPPDPYLRHPGARPGRGDAARRRRHGPGLGWGGARGASSRSLRLLLLLPS